MVVNQRLWGGILRRDFRIEIDVTGARKAPEQEAIGFSTIFLSLCF
jgi:hypothetical protein